jgi:hypothetical protein
MTLCVRVSACLLLAPTAPDSTVTLRRSTEITSDIAPRFFSAYVESYVKCLLVPHQNARHWPFFILKIPRYNYDPSSCPRRKTPCKSSCRDCASRPGPRGTGDMHAGRAHRRVVTTCLHYQIGDLPMTVCVKFENPPKYVTNDRTQCVVLRNDTTQCVVLQDDTIMCRLDLSFRKTTK